MENRVIYHGGKEKYVGKIVIIDESLCLKPQNTMSEHTQTKQEV